VTFHGLKTKGEIAEFMREADLFVLPSIWENLPCVIIEAMASGLPMVSTLTGGIPEIVNDEVGILVPPGNVNALSGAIALMLRRISEFDRLAIGQRGQRYRLERVGASLHGLYEECLER
jgi:glycosyltransferase involved in cell wall biosynthesis